MAKKVACPWCGSTKFTHRGAFPRHRYQCKNEKCKRYFQSEYPDVPEIYILDIETLPLEVYSWGVYKQRINPDNVIRDWCLLSYSAKRLFSPKVTGRILTPAEATKRDDKKLTEEISQILNNADIIIAHNGKSFDIPKINNRLLMHDIRPPSPYQVIDTKDAAAKALGFTSNKLDYIAKKLGLGQKKHTDFDLWVQCSNGNKEALQYMLEYNKEDVILLEDVYVKLRPWIFNHPNLGLYMNLDQTLKTCPNCNSDDLDLDGTYTTTASVFDSFSCNNCGARGRNKKSKRTAQLRTISG